jgi:hypothetical protein
MTQFPYGSVMPTPQLTFTVPRVVATTLGIRNIPNAARLAGVLDDRFRYRPVSDGFAVECSRDVAAAFLQALRLFVEHRDVSADFLIETSRMAKTVTHLLCCSFDADEN